MLREKTVSKKEQSHMQRKEERKDKQCSQQTWSEWYYAAIAMRGRTYKEPDATGMDRSPKVVLHRGGPILHHSGANSSRGASTAKLLGLHEWLWSETGAALGPDLQLDRTSSMATKWSWVRGDIETKKKYSQLIPWIGTLIFRVIASLDPQGDQRWCEWKAKTKNMGNGWMQLPHIH